MSYTKLLSTLFIGLQLVACGGVPHQSPTQRDFIQDRAVVSTLSQEDLMWRAHYQALSSIDTFSFTARAALRTDTDGLQFGIEGVFKEGLFIDLSGPMGFGKVRLILHPEKEMYVLMTSDGHYTAASEASLTEGIFKVAVPVAPLSSWVKGIPYDLSLTRTTFNEDGQLLSFYENGFQITLSDYRAVSEWQMPKKITISREGFKLKLVINDFTKI